MRLFLFILACLSGSATLAQAQDLAAEYREAYNQFSLTSDVFGFEEEADAIAAVLPGMQGDWISLTLISDGQSTFDDSRISEFCSKHFFRLTQTAPHSFTFARTNSEGVAQVTTRYDYRGYHSFQRAADEAEIVELYQIPEGTPILPGMLSGGVFRGEIELFLASENIIVMQVWAGPVEIYGRCPAS
jgi:hypothetical protein